MATALEGVTIIDLTHMLSGPYAGMILADLGAETVKVEPLAGEGTRKLLQSDPEYSLGDQGAYFITLNRNKKSVAIDLKSPDGLEVFYDLVRDADIVLDNFAADVTAKLKIDYAHLCQVNPKIITCSISGFGSDGPQYRRTAFDQVVQALGGGMSITGLDKDTPMRAGIPIGDFDTSVASVYGQVEFDINDTMELAFALRYDYESRDVNNKVPNVAGSGLNVNLLDGNFQALPINAALSNFPNGIPNRSESFSQLQPKVTWSWQASDEINVYASYGVGFRSGGFNSVGTEDTLNFWFNAGYGGPGEAVGAGISVPDAYDKEVSTNIELGAKGEFMDRRLRVNAALFRTNVDDNQFFEFFAGPFGLLRSVTTIDELYIEGFEADVNFVLNEEISLFGGIGLMSSEIEANRHRPLSVGNDVPQAPEKTATLGAQYVKQLGEGLELGVRADWQYTGAMWFHTLQGEESPTIWNAFFGPGFNSDFLDPATGSNAQRDAYDTLNLRISLSSEQWSVTAWGKNITDELYLQEVIPAPEFGGTFNHPSAQAAYGVDFTYRF